MNFKKIHDVNWEKLKAVCILVIYFDMNFSSRKVDRPGGISQDCSRVSFFLMGASYPWVVCIPDKCAKCSCSFPYFTYLTIWNYLNTCISTQKWSWIEWIIKIKRGQSLHSLCSSTLCQTQPIVHKKNNSTKHHWQIR